MSACCCIDIDYEDPEFHRQTEPRARKHYQCGECSGEIKPGQKYRREVGLWEGDFQTHITCAPCAAVRDDRMSCGFYYGRIWEDIAECYRYSGDECSSLAWLHPMFADDVNDCECPECLAESGRLEEPANER